MARLSPPQPLEPVLRRAHTLLEAPRIAAGGSVLYSDEVIEVPAGFVSSLSFGGADGCDV